MLTTTPPSHPGKHERVYFPMAAAAAAADDDDDDDIVG